MILSGTNSSPAEVSLGPTYLLMEQSLPFLPAHSMSKLRILNGATFDQSPSGWWAMNSSHDTSNSIWLREIGGGFLTSSLFLWCLCRKWYFPAGTSIQLQPTTLLSTINLKKKNFERTWLADLKKNQRIWLVDLKINKKHENWIKNKQSPKQ